MILKDNVYDILATIQRLLAPIATFAVAICGVFGWTQSGEQIAAVISAFAVFLGAFLKICSNKYFDTGNVTFVNPELHEGENHDGD